MGDVVTLAGAAPVARSKAKGGRWEPWEGGRKWIGADGKVAAYYIRRRIGGVLREIRLPATKESAACAHLRSFESDPGAFDPAGTERAEPIYLDEKFSERFLEWSLAPKSEGGAGNTARWVAEQGLYLKWWAERLRGVDLRRASLEKHVLPHLRGATARQKRIAVIRRVYSWLRKAGMPLEDGAIVRIRREEDPTLDTLPVPQYDPAQRRKRKARTAAEIAAVMKHTTDRWRDLLTVLAATGAHVSELQRFAKDGAVEPLPPGARGKGLAAVLVLPATKAGGAHRVPVGKVVAASARRVLEAGSFDRVKLAAAMADASVKAKVPKMTPGTMRHSVATHAMNAGADLATIAAFLHHADKRTTARWYATLGVPAKIPTPV